MKFAGDERIVGVVASLFHEFADEGSDETTGEMIDVFVEAEHGFGVSGESVGSNFLRDFGDERVGAEARIVFIKDIDALHDGSQKPAPAGFGEVFVQVYLPVGADGLEFHLVCLGFGLGFDFFECVVKAFWGER